MAIKAPEGTRDLLPDEALFWHHFQDVASTIFGRYGYVRIDTPIIEQTELFRRGIGEATDVVSKEMFTAISGENLKRLLEGENIKSKSRLSLRPEGTAGVVRAVVQHDLVPDGAPPVKLMYAGPMFRAERPQRGRQRQFNQVGVECLGSDAPTIDAEGIAMMMIFLKKVGIPKESMRLLINSMGCEKCRPTYREMIRGYMESRADELCETCLSRMSINPLRAFDCKNESCAQVMAEAPKITDHLCQECSEHYAEVKSLLDSVGVEYEEDPTLVRGLDYYTRTVFEVQTIEDQERAQNALGGGGRYDKLAEEIGGRSMPGFGFAIGYDRCALAFEDSGKKFLKARKCDLFIACVEDDVRAKAFKMMQLCRCSGISAEMDHQSRSLKSQFKLADKLDASCVAILGPDELVNDQVRLRNMHTHEEEVVYLDVFLASVKEMIG